jgi:hypothetical protein
MRAEADSFGVTGTFLCYAGAYATEGPRLRHADTRFGRLLALLVLVNLTEGSLKMSFKLAFTAQILVSPLSLLSAGSRAALRLTR